MSLKPAETPTTVTDHERRPERSRTFQELINDLQAAAFACGVSVQRDGAPIAVEKYLPGYQRVATEIERQLAQAAALIPVEVREILDGHR